MSESNQTQTNPTTAAYQSTEELVAAQAANDNDALLKAQADLAALQAKRADLADQYLRAKAEAENARRRAEDEISKARKFAVESFAESLLPAKDSLEMSLNLKDITPEKLREGVEATLRQLA